MGPIQPEGRVPKSRHEVQRELRSGIGVNPLADPSERNGTFALFSTPSAFKKTRAKGIAAGGQPMIDRFRDFARTLLTVLLLGVTGAAAQSSQSLTSPPGAAPQGASAPSIQAGAVPAGSTGPQINIAEITTRANHDVGVNIETTITGWQRSARPATALFRAKRLS